MSSATATASSHGKATRPVLPLLPESMFERIQYPDGRNALNAFMANMTDPQRYSNIRYCHHLPAPITGTVNLGEIEVQDATGKTWIYAVMADELTRVV